MFVCLRAQVDSSTFRKKVRLIMTLVLYNTTFWRASWACMKLPMALARMWSVEYVPVYLYHSLRWVSVLDLVTERNWRYILRAYLSLTVRVFSSVIVDFILRTFCLLLRRWSTPRLIAYYVSISLISHSLTRLPSHIYTPS
jgi:multidrug transporter EmrE-like cation transporter